MSKEVYDIGWYNTMFTLRDGGRLGGYAYVNPTEWANVLINMGDAYLEVGGWVEVDVDTGMETRRPVAVSSICMHEDVLPGEVMVDSLVLRKIDLDKKEPQRRQLVTLRSLYDLPVVESITLKPADGYEWPEDGTVPLDEISSGLHQYLVLMRGDIICLPIGGGWWHFMVWDISNSMESDLRMGRTTSPGDGHEITLNPSSPVPFDLYRPPVYQWRV